MLRLLTILSLSLAYAYGTPNWDNTLIPESSATPIALTALNFADGYFYGEGTWLLGTAQTGNLTVSAKKGTIQILWQDKLLWAWDTSTHWNYIGLQVQTNPQSTNIRVWQNEDTAVFKEITVHEVITVKTWSWAGNHFQPRTLNAYQQPGPWLRAIQKKDLQ